jgi:hypothetical protein
MAIAVVTPYDQFLDDDGEPLNGGTVTVYDATTTNLRAIYTDTALSITATNPIPLDAAGRPDQGMIYTAATAYKILVKNASGTQVGDTADNIDPGIPLGSGVLAIANGGTSGATAAAARAALGAVGTADIADLEAEVAALAGAAGSSERTSIAVGTTLQRPAVPEPGDIRLNTDTDKFEGVRTGSTFENFVTDADRSSTAAIAASTAEATFLSPDRAVYGPWAPKAWGSTTGAGTPVLSSGSHNVTSITDVGGGTFRFNLSITMSSTTYTAIPVLYDASSSVRYCSISARTTTAVTVLVKDASGNAADPDGGVGVVVFGALA